MSQSTHAEIFFSLTTLIKYNTYILKRKQKSNLYNMIIRFPN